MEDVYEAAWLRYQHHYLAINGQFAAVYPGVVEGLQQMRDAGLQLACLTNKPLSFAKPLLQAKVPGLAVSMGRTLRCDMDGQFTRFQPLDWVSLDGALRLCFPSPLFSRAYFVQKLGAWDSVRIGADAEIFQRIRRFDPSALHTLDTPVMLQLDLPDSLTRHEDTHNDERGEAPARTVYRQAWSAWHAEHTEMPKLHFPKTN
jgi:hypothetical protein